MPKETPKKKETVKKLVKLPDLNTNFSEMVSELDPSVAVSFRFSLQNLERMLSLFKFAKDDKSTDLPVFYYQGTMVFLKNQLDASKAGAVPVELLEGSEEEVACSLFTLDYALLQQVYTTMKQIERKDIILEIKGNNTINYIIGSFNLPGKLQTHIIELPYSKLDELTLGSIMPVSNLSKILDISYAQADSNHSALDNIFIDGDTVLGGTRGLLYRTNSLFENLEDIIGFNHKYYSDIASFSSLAQGEISVNLGVSQIRGEKRNVIEFSSYDCRLVVPLSALNEGDLANFTAIKDSLESDENSSGIQIHCTVKALKRSLTCMELALYGLKTNHKVTISSEGTKVIVSATPLTNDKAEDVLSCNVKNAGEASVELGISYLFDAINSFDANDDIIIDIPSEDSPSRVKIYGKVKSGDYKNWVTVVYDS